MSLTDSLIADLHGVRPGERLQDEELFRRRYESLSRFIDGDDPPMVIYTVRANGGGRARWHGIAPPAAQHDAIAKVAHLLHRRLVPMTGGSWIVAIGAWNGFELRYDWTCAAWIDPRGDMPFTVERDERPEWIAANAESYVQQCFNAWSRYQEVLRAAGITREHMTDKAATGVGYDVIPVPSREQVLKALRLTR